MQDNTFSDIWEWAKSSLVWHKIQKPQKETVCGLAAWKQSLYSQRYNRKSWKTDNDGEKIFATLQQVYINTSNYKEVWQWDKRKNHSNPNPAKDANKQITGEQSARQCSLLEALIKRGTSWEGLEMTSCVNGWRQGEYLAQKEIGEGSTVQ